MRRHVLTFYFIKELTLYFLVSFLFFFLIFFVNQILLMAEEILKKRVPIFDVVLLIWYSLPFIIAQSAPFATLVGFLMCLGNMVSQNEILVLRALGKSFFTILIPVLLCGTVISLISFFVNDYLLPAGTIGTNQLYRKISLSNPGVILESHAVKRTKNAVIIAGEVSGKNISHLLFFDTDADGNQRIIAAGHTEAAEQANSSVLMQLQMKDAYITTLNKKNPRNFDTVKTAQTDLSIFDADIPAIASGENPREMTAWDLNKYITSMTQQGTIGEFTLNSWKLEFHKKFALPFGSIFFAFFAVPLALLFGKHNGQTIGLIIGICVSVLYWAMLILGQTFGLRSGLNGVLAMWVPNLAILVGGFFFFTRLVKK